MDPQDGTSLGVYRFTPNFTTPASTTLVGPTYLSVAAYTDSKRGVLAACHAADCAAKVAPPRAFRSREPQVTRCPRGCCARSHGSLLLSDGACVIPLLWRC